MSVGEIGWGPCRFRIFWSGSTWVKDVDAPNRSHRSGHALWIRREPVRGCRDVAVAR